MKSTPIGTLKLLESQIKLACELYDTLPEDWQERLSKARMHLGDAGLYVVAQLVTLEISGNLLPHDD